MINDVEFIEYKKRILELIFEFASSNNAKLKFSESDLDKQEEKEDLNLENKQFSDQLKKDNIKYYIITNNENYPDITLWFRKMNDHKFMLYLDTQKFSGMTLPVYNILDDKKSDIFFDLKIMPVFSDDTIKKLNENTEGFDNKLNNFLLIAFHGNFNKVFNIDDKGICK